MLNNTPQRCPRRDKMPAVPILNYRFNGISKLSADFLEEINRLIITFTWKCKGSVTVKTCFKISSNVTGLLFLDFNIYHQAVVINIVWYCVGMNIYISED